MYFIVNGSIWQIKNVGRFDNNLMRLDGSFALGICDNNQNTIFICNSVSDEKYIHIMTHEICHAYCFEYGVVLDTDTEEMLCNFVADYGRNIIDTVDKLTRILEIAV